LEAERTEAMAEREAIHGQELDHTQEAYLRAKAELEEKYAARVSMYQAKEEALKQREVAIRQRSKAADEEKEQWYEELLLKEDELLSREAAVKEKDVPLNEKMAALKAQATAHKSKKKNQKKTVGFAAVVTDTSRFAAPESNLDFAATQLRSMANRQAADPVIAHHAELLAKVLRSAQGTNTGAV